MKYFIIYTCFISALVRNVDAKRTDVVTLQTENLWVKPAAKFCFAAAPAIIGCGLYAIKQPTSSFPDARLIYRDTLYRLFIASSAITAVSYTVDHIREQYSSDSTKLLNDAYKKHAADHGLGYTASSVLGSCAGLAASGFVAYGCYLNDTDNENLKAFFFTLPLLLGGVHTLTDTAFKYKHSQFSTSSDPVSGATTFWLWMMNFIKKCCYTSLVLPASLGLIHGYLEYTGQWVPRHHRDDDYCVER